jgi:hypothetical protein
MTRKIKICHSIAGEGSYASIEFLTLKVYIIVKLKKLGGFIKK